MHTSITFRRLVAVVAATAALLAASPLAAQKAKAPPLANKGEVEGWLGTYAATVETVEIAWQDDRLVVVLLGVPVPVDGQWHELTEPMAVAYRLTWVPEREVISLEEKHSQSVHWHYELKLEREGQHLAKYERMAGDPDAVLSRTFKRKPAPPETME